MTLDNKPLFSIVMVNYNQGDFIEEAIQSVINQGCDDYEFIIIDGASTDNSKMTIEKYSSKLAYWVSEKDNGQSDAFNKGFSRARGEFYFWLNADDILLPNSLSLAKKEIKKRPEGKWFTANTIFMNTEGRIIRCSRGPRWYDFLLKNGQLYVYGPTSIFHKDLFKEAGGFDLDLNFTMDTDLWMRFKLLGYRFIRIQEYFWTFRIHEQSKTSHSFSEKPKENFQKEIEYIFRKNGFHFTRGGMLKQKIFKLMMGHYLRSAIDTLRFKGKNYRDFISKNNE